MESPFSIEVYSKEDRLRDRENRPKLGLRRLTEDRKLVSVEIDLPYDEYTTIKEKFDWDLGKDKVSTVDFCRELVSALGLPSESIVKIQEQMLSQIMEHIKTHTCQPRQDENQEKNNALRFGYFGEDEIEKEENDKKRLTRVRRNQMKRTVGATIQPTGRYLKEKKCCRHCKLENLGPGYQCRHCRLPFELSEVLNFQDRRVKIAAMYYERIAGKVPLLTYQAKKRLFEKEDFDSFYAIYNKMRGIFEGSDQLSKEGLAQVRYIMERYYEHFLNSRFDYQDNDIVQQVVDDKVRRSFEETKETTTCVRADNGGDLANSKSSAMSPPPTSIQTPLQTPTLNPKKTTSTDHSFALSNIPSLYPIKYPSSIHPFYQTSLLPIPQISLLYPPILLNIPSPHSIKYPSSIHSFYQISLHLYISF